MREHAACCRSVFCRCHFFLLAISTMFCVINSRISLGSIFFNHFKQTDEERVHRAAGSSAKDS